MIKVCEYCGKDFEANINQKFCTKYCRKHAYYHQNTKQILYQNKQWAINNPEKITIGQKRWAKENVENRQKYQKQYKINNQKRLQQYFNKYYRDRRANDLCNSSAYDPSHEKSTVVLS